MDTEDLFEYVYGVNVNTDQDYGDKMSSDEGMIIRDVDSCGQPGEFELSRNLYDFLSAQPSRNDWERDIYFYHSDHLGSTSYITDNAGYPSQHVDYVPFGEVLLEEKGASWATPYKFNCKELDAESGLYYYGARYYDPRTSVWLGVDPLSDKYPGLSLFVYCLNNPIRIIDPNGEDVEETDNKAKEVISKYTQKNNADGSLNKNYQKSFADIYNKWKEDHSLMVKFSTDMSGKDPNTGGTISYGGNDEQKRTVFNVKWDESITERLGTSGVFEESYHLKDGLDGNFDVKSGSNNGFSLENEIKAKQWVVNNIDGIKTRYNNLSTGVNEKTHYGYFKENLLNLDKLRDGLINGIRTYGVGQNSARVSYNVFGFGGYTK